MSKGEVLARVLARFRELGVRLPATDYAIKRTYAGANQRCEGAWSWFLWSHEDANAMNCGSWDRASAIAAHPERFELYTHAVTKQHSLVEKGKES